MPDHRITEEVWILEGRRIKQLPVLTIKLIYYELADTLIHYQFSYRNPADVKWYPENQVFKTKEALIDSL